MKRFCALALAAVAGWASAAERLPAVNLWVELRWVTSSLAPATQAAVRDGAVVVGTGGVVSPRGSVTVAETVAGKDSGRQQVQGLQRLQVLNGQRASVQLRQTEPWQWLDAVVELDPAQAASQARRVFASPRQGERVVQQGYRVGVAWPGGTQPVRVEFGVEQGAGVTVESTVLLPLNEWRSVARSGGAGPAEPRGAITSRAAEPVSGQELQIRVALAP